MKFSDEMAWLIVTNLSQHKYLVLSQIKSNDNSFFQVDSVSYSLDRNNKRERQNEALTIPPLSNRCTARVTVCQTSDTS